MSYDITFKVKVEGINEYVSVGDCSANITYNVREIIVRSTGLEWKNGENNGLCKDIMPKIKHGLDELIDNPEKYEPYESPNGWGTVRGTRGFFMQILEDWDSFKRWYPELLDVVTFWIE